MVGINARVHIEDVTRGYEVQGMKKKVPFIWVTKILGGLSPMFVSCPPRLQFFVNLTKFYVAMAMQSSAAHSILLSY